MKKRILLIGFVLLSVSNIKAQNWNLGGNVATGTSFLGTTNAQPLNLKTEMSQPIYFYTNSGAGTLNNLRMMINGSNSFVGLNHSNPRKIIIN